MNDQLGHTYSYDAEDRPYSASGVTYYYDGEGERVAKSSGKLYWFGSSSAPVLETDVSGNTTEEYVFFNGKRTAMRDAGTLGAIHYYFADQIGSTNVVTNASGNMPPQQDIEYHPYGEQQVYTDTLGQQYRFTAHEHDVETNNDYFGARYYSSSFGRFITADWAATPVPVPYADTRNPQSLNLYSYQKNSPMVSADIDGHCEPFCGAAIGAAVGVLAVVGSELYHGEDVFTKQSGVRILGGLTGGAIVGGTMGVASEAGLPLLQQAITGASASVVAGVADRGITTGSMNSATENPGEIGHDAVWGVISVGVEHGAANAFERAGSEELRQAMKDMERKGSVRGKEKAATKVSAAENAVKEKAEKAGAAAGAVKDVIEKVNQRPDQNRSDLKTDRPTNASDERPPGTFVK